MLISFSGKPLLEAWGIFNHNKVRIIKFVVVAVVVCIAHEYFELDHMELPVAPVTVLGGGLAIFLAFRNNSAYDRWWEARKIWGGIVNYSRTFAMQVISFSSDSNNPQMHATDEELKKWQKEMIYRHIAWLYALTIHLRKKGDWDELGKYLSEEEMKQLPEFVNKPTQLINLQGKSLKYAFEKGIIDSFRHIELSEKLEEFYNLQGMSERIKNTIFPYYYNYFTRVFLWLFVICLPMALVKEMGWVTVPMSIAISFVFSILEKAGNITEEPFEGRAADTPITTISRAIEIDLRQMLGEKDLPEPMPIQIGRFGVKFQS